MESYTASCYEFLLNKSIRVQKIWIEACIEWVQEEQKKLPLKHELFSILYEQWLMADLREVAEGVLPSSLNKGTHTLNGLFALQVNSAVDIGHSAYSQLQKTKGQEIIDTGNEDINEFFSKGANDKASIIDTKWKEVSSQMLLLDITDGSSTVEAIEYQPFKEINQDSFQPGCKVLIKGPVQCRNNLILLKQENIQLLGGNVESLLESNTIENLLCKVLKTDHDTDIKPNVRSESNNKGDIKKETNEKVLHKNNKNKTSEKIFSVDNKNINIPMNKDIINCNLAAKQYTLPKKNQSLSKSIKTEIADDFFENDMLDNFPLEDLGLLEYSQPKSAKLNLIEKKVNKTSSISPKQCFLKNKVLCSNATLNKNNNSHLNDNNFNKKYEQDNIDCELDVDADLFLDDVDIISNLNCKISKDKTSCKTSSNQTKIEESEAKTKVESNYNSLYRNQKDSSCAKDFHMAEKEYDSLSDFVENNSVNTVLNVKCWFQTLTSKLEFQDFFKISGIITDGIKNIEVVLTDKVLFSIIGYSSKEVLEAVNGKLPSSRKSSIKQALKNAEQRLEKGKWLAKICCDINNIYNILEMTQIN
ncbi:recQ-mediated genome instability protein 1 isoform X1 [Hydra vulgaris]|uniref:recQ-mediated genome instability protein 1 isoform X1 n=1 Tax=Hydra vulgaris TaxID=6087 RepID=UPI001F5E5866|nr:recQ-mediated genome instability protein 1-like isoform X1 [Hydra vulgaris]XP_047128819.1 recQ-mediated genome instability protein 1-like isoform X1 [Hydra vulgaris]